MQIKTDTACVSKTVDGVISPELARELGLKGSDVEKKKAGMVTLPNGEKRNTASEYTFPVQAGNTTVFMTFMEMNELQSGMLMGNRGLARLGITRKLEEILAESANTMLEIHGIDEEKIHEITSQDFQGGL